MCQVTRHGHEYFWFQLTRSQEDIHIRAELCGYAAGIDGDLSLGVCIAQLNNGIGPGYRWSDVGVACGTLQQFADGIIELLTILEHAHVRLSLTGETRL